MRRVYPTTMQGGMSASGSYLLMLTEPESNRQVPVIIGAYEAHAIIMAGQNAHARRPLTHELMLATMEAFGLSLLSVSIDRVMEGIFFATLHVTDGFNSKDIDSRTTDAVALALHAGVPIMMAEAVLDEAGVRQTTAEADRQPSLEQLLEELARCEEREDYERAAELQEKILEIKRKQNNDTA